MCLRAVSTLLPCEWLLFPFLFLSLSCSIASRVAFNPADLLWVHLFRKRVPLYSQGLELPAWDCFYTQTGEGAKGETRGRAPPGPQGWHSCPCMVWGKTPRSGQCWAESASVAVKGEEPQVIWLRITFWVGALGNFIAISSQIKPGYRQEPIFLFTMWLNKAREQNASIQGISRHLRHLECQLYWQKASSPVIRHCCPGTHHRNRDFLIAARNLGSSLLTPRVVLSKPRSSCFVVWFSQLQSGVRTGVHTQSQAKP